MEKSTKIKYFKPNHMTSFPKTMECTKQQFRAWRGRQWRIWRKHVRMAGVDLLIDGQVTKLKTLLGLDAPEIIVSNEKRRLVRLRYFRRFGEEAARKRWNTDMKASWTEVV